MNKQKYIGLTFLILFAGFWSVGNAKESQSSGSTYLRSTHIRKDIEFRFAESNPTGDLAKVESDDGSDRVFVYPKAELTSADIEEAILTKGNAKMLVVRLRLTKSGSEKLTKLTEENKGKRLAVLSGGKLLIAPIIMSAISGGILEFYEVNNDDRTRWIYKQIVKG